MTEAGHRFAWALSLGLAVAGSLAAHGVAYRIAEPDAHRREHLLEQTGHGYFDPELVLSVCVALVVVGFAGRVLAGTRHGHRPPVWLFALAPPVGFAIQEHAERFLHHEALAHHFFEPAFLVGLALQLPFALVALLAARGLLAAAGVLARQIGSPPRPGLVPNARLAAPATRSLACSPVLVGARGQRAPPFSPAFAVRPRCPGASKPGGGGDDHPQEDSTRKPARSGPRDRHGVRRRARADRARAFHPARHRAGERRRRPGVA